MNALSSFDEIIAAAAAADDQRAPVRIAFAAAAQRESLLAAHHIHQAGWASSLLFGDASAIKRLAGEEDLPLSEFAEVIDVPELKEAALQAAEAVGKGEAEVLIKGQVSTADFMHAALNPQANLRTERRLTHVALYDMPQLGRLIFLSDAGIAVAPSLEEKMDIIQNAVDLARALGVGKPRVGVLAATETIQPKIRATSEAAILSKMAERGQINHCWVDGPLSLDSAMDPTVAKRHQLSGPVAGAADVLIVPDIDSGNMLGKAMSYFAGGSMAGVVLGARKPLVVVSRSDTERAKQVSVAIALLAAKHNLT